MSLLKRLSGPDDSGERLAVKIRRIDLVQRKLEHQL